MRITISNNKTCYECNIQHSGIHKNGREFVDGNAKFVQDMILAMFHIDERYQKVFIEKFIDFNIYNNNLAYIINGRSFYKEKYFDFFYNIFFHEYYYDDENHFIKFINKKDNSIVYYRKDKDYRFENFIKDTNYRLYYKHKIEPFDYDKTIADLYEKYYYLRMKILRDVCLYGTGKISYEECDKILQELAKEFKYPHKKNGFYDKFQLGRLGEDYI